MFVRDKHMPVINDIFDLEYIDKGFAVSYVAFL